MIHVYIPARRPALDKMIRAAITNGTSRRVVVHDVLAQSDLPKTAHLVTHCGTGDPSSYDEWFAARLKTYVTCLPDAAEWFRDKVDRLTLDGDVRIVDATCRKIVKR